MPGSDQSAIRGAVEALLREKFGVVHYNRIAGEPATRFVDLLTDAEPPNPKAGIRLFAVLNGSNKVELRAKAPTGGSTLLFTEP